jgi:hypothetical protein
MFRFLLVIVVMLALMLAVIPAFAQDTTPTPPPFQPPPALDEVASGLLGFIYTSLAGGAWSLVTVNIVSLLKRIPALGNISGNHLNAIIAVVLAVGFYAFDAFGLRSVYLTAIKGFEDFYPAIAAVLGLVVGNFAGNKSLYQTAHNLHLPVVGYARTPEISRQVELEERVIRSVQQVLRSQTLIATGPDLSIRG